MGVSGWARGDTVIEATDLHPHFSVGGSAFPLPIADRVERSAIEDWANDLVTRIGTEHPGQHVTVFVPPPGEPRGSCDDTTDGPVVRLFLAAQVSDLGDDAGGMDAGVRWVPLEGSICGRVYRTGLAALCADVAMDPDFLASPGSRTRSSLTVPIGPPGAVVGVINLEAPYVSAFSILDYERVTAAAAAAYDRHPGEPQP